MVKMNDKYIPDRKFLEFWGNLFLNVAKGQEQIEQLSSIMNIDSISKMDFMNFKEMSRMFKESYGLPAEASDRENKSHDEAQRLKLDKSFEEFQNSFARYITMWGVIPNKAHEELKQRYHSLQNENRALKRDYEALKQKTEMQEELISQLRDLLNAKGMGHIELFNHIQNLTLKQTREFQNLIENLQTMFTTENNKEQG